MNCMDQARTALAECRDKAVQKRRPIELGTWPANEKEEEVQIRAGIIFVTLSHFEQALHQACTSSFLTLPHRDVPPY